MFTRKSLATAAAAFGITVLSLGATAAPAAAAVVYHSPGVTIRLWNGHYPRYHHRHHHRWHRVKVCRTTWHHHHRVKVCTWERRWS